MQILPRRTSCEISNKSPQQTYLVDDLRFQTRLEVGGIGDYAKGGYREPADKGWR